MLVVGLTGGIATGKSTASQVFIDRGIPVIDADRIARQVVEPGTPTYRQLRAELGAEFFDDDNGGALIREKLGKEVFANPEKRRKLNRITHPAIRKKMFMELVTNFFIGTSIVVLDAPLLFEGGYDRMLTRIVVVWCEADQELERLMARDGLSKEDALARIGAQMSIEEKKKRATILLDNTGTKEQLVDQINKVIDDLQQSWTPIVVRTGFWTVVVGLMSSIFWCLFRRIL